MDTGVSLAWERRLAPMFIRSPEYGTRCSTLLLLHEGGEIHFAERRFDPAGRVLTPAGLPLDPEHFVL